MTPPTYRVWFRFWPTLDLAVLAQNESGNTTHKGLHLHPLPQYKYTVNFIYGAAILTGIGGTTLLVTSLSMVADLIGKHCVS